MRVSLMVMMCLLLAGFTVSAEDSQPVNIKKTTKINCTKDWCSIPEHFQFAITGNDKLMLEIPFNDTLTLQMPAGEEILGDKIQITVDIVSIESLGGRLFSVFPSVPKQIKDKPKWLIGRKTSLRMNFKSGRSLNLNLKMGRNGITRLELTSPKMEKQIAWREKVRLEERKKLEAEYSQKQEKLDAEANQLALQILGKHSTKRIQCREIDEREITDLLVGVATSLCMVGDYLLVNFEIENRRRSLAVFADNSVALYIKEGEELNKLDSILVWEKDRAPQLRYDRSGRGALILPVSDDTVGREFFLKISEVKGRQREVLIDDIEF